MAATACGPTSPRRACARRRSSARSPSPSGTASTASACRSASSAPTPAALPAAWSATGWPPSTSPPPAAGCRPRGLRRPCGCSSAPGPRCASIRRPTRSSTGRAPAASTPAWRATGARSPCSRRRGGWPGRWAPAAASWRPSSAPTSGRCGSSPAPTRRGWRRPRGPSRRARSNTGSRSPSAGTCPWCCPPGADRRRARSDRFRPLMKVGVPRESADGERRVALVPDVVKRLQGKGVEVVVEAGAGEQALIPDALYTDAGASIGDPWGPDVVVRAAPPTAEEIGRLQRGGTLVGFLAPRTQPETLQALARAGVTAFAMEAIPRISRAQSMDALSSQANVAGYKAALLGADHATRFYPMLMTAAGTIPPAKVLVLGVGVAGPQAPGTARGRGGQTTGYDVRPEVAEQVQSLGAKWLDLGIEAAGEGGYARELTDEEKAQQQQALTDAIKGFDVVITTALVPGRPAPRLVTSEAVEGMKPGSVIVDLAGETGGNCELTEPGQTAVKHNVTIVSPLNLPATMPEHASALYARNLQALIELLADDESGALAPDFADEVIAGACVIREGKVVS